MGQFQAQKLPNISRKTELFFTRKRSRITVSSNVILSERSESKDPHSQKIRLRQRILRLRRLWAAALRTTFVF
jgi:hypothetical protein